MSVSVYFSNQIIQIAVGSRGKIAKLDRVLTTYAPEGSIINGIVMNSESLGAHIKKFWEENNIPKKDVYLVVNSNKIAGKNVEVPVMDEKKTLKFVMREFSDMQREDDSLAYIQMGTDKKTRIRKLYAELAPKEQLREFINIFNDMGINLKGIISGEGSIIGYAGRILTKSAKTFNLQIINGNIVSNVLFVDGTFRYYNSVRCFNDPGTPEYLDDLGRSLNQLSQFMRAEKITSPMEKVFIAGTVGEHVPTYSQVVKDYGVDAPVELVNTGLSSNQELLNASQVAIYAVSGLYDQGPRSNFLTNFNVKEDNENAMDPVTKRRIAAVVGTFVLMLIAFGVSLTLRLVREARYNEAREYNKSALVVSQTKDYDMATARRDAALAKYNSINTVVDTIESYPVCTDEIIDILEETASGYADIEILSFDAEAGQVSFSAKARNVNDIYKYIDELLNQEIFMRVDHTGYTYDSSNDLYDIHVSCTLAESVGRDME
ncbi:MAG: hypothetical protein K6E10_03345 [Eubacterium sp.]|nr:hypothetical protein [Eubacterium sp.]